MQIGRSLSGPELRSNPEFQSALVRLGVWLFSVLYIGLGAATHYYAVDVGYFFAFFGAFLCIFIALGVSVVLRPIWPARRYAALVADVAGASLAIFLTREAISPFYLLYIWLFISYGTRYGETHLKVASALSVVAYNLVLFALDEWSRHTFEAFFFLLLLVILPLYQHSLLRQVHEARQEAERANQAKSDFLSTMTHELRTPLSGILGMSRLLQSTQLGPQQRDYVHSIVTSSQMLGALIGDILDLSKIEAQKLTLECVGFDLRATVIEVCTACQIQALDKGLELVCSLDPDLPKQVMGDELRLRQILFNLVGNAIKFTERGEVEVRLGLAQANEVLSQRHLLLEVRDTGIGIAPHKLAHLFDGFWQADASTSRRFGGTGLGTTIARDLTRLMGGEIGVESEEQRGSLFWVRLPLLAEGFQVEDAAPATELRGCAVLVYEQNSSAREALMRICKGLGMRPYALERLEDLPALKQRMDAAIIADSPQGVDLPAMAEQLQRYAGGDLALLFLTYGSRSGLGLSNSSPCLNKPCLPEHLGSRLLQILQHRIVPQETVAIADSESAARSPDGFQVLVAEDDAIAAKVITTFLGMQGHRTTLTRNGRETLEQAHSGTYDIAFVDLRMPQVDGLEFTRRHREQELPGQRLPIVALTANAAEEIKQEALDAGMDAFLSKPVNPGELETLIRRFVLEPA